MCKHVHIISKFHMYTFSDNLNRFLDFIFTYSFLKVPNLNRTFVLVYQLSDH